MNLGPVNLVILMAPFLLLVVFIMKKCCCIASIRNYASKEMKRTLINRVIVFLEGIMMVVCTSAWINLNQVQGDKADQNLSWYVAIIFIVFYIAYTIGIQIYLGWNFEDLFDQFM